MSTASLVLAAHVEALRRVVGSVTHARLIASPIGERAGDAFNVTLPALAPLRAFGALHRAQLDLSIDVEAVQNPAGAAEWAIRTIAYTHVLLDRNGTEVLAFRWQPGPTYAGPDHPHAHVSAPVRFPDARGNAVHVELDKLHLATGPVPLAAFVRTLIEEFGARPLATDWRQRLEQGG